MSKALTIKNQSNQIEQSGTAEILLQQAIEKGLPVEALEKLLIMRRELKEERAKSLFFQSLSAFQSECPEIKKDQTVYGKDGTPRYKYASLDSIIKQVKHLLQKHGFSYTFKTEYEQNQVTVTCVVTHVAGHQEEASFTAPIEQASFMSDIQKVGSALTYAKRYSFCAAFGIMTADEDTDANITVDSSQEAEIKQAEIQDTEKAEVNQAETNKNQDAEKIDDKKQKEKRSYQAKTIFATIERINKKEKENPDGKKWILYGIQAGGSWYNTFNKDLYDIAQKNIGQSVSITYEEREKGKFLLNLEPF